MGYPHIATAAIIAEKRSVLCAGEKKKKNCRNRMEKIQTHWICMLVIDSRGRRGKKKVVVCQLPEKTRPPAFVATAGGEEVDASHKQREDIACFRLWKRKKKKREFSRQRAVGSSMGQVSDPLMGQSLWRPALPLSKPGPGA